MSFHHNAMANKAETQSKQCTAPLSSSEAGNMLPLTAAQ